MRDLPEINHGLHLVPRMRSISTTLRTRKAAPQSAFIEISLFWQQKTHAELHLPTLLCSARPEGALGTDLNPQDPWASNSTCFCKRLRKVNLSWVHHHLPSMLPKQSFQSPHLLSSQKLHCQSKFLAVLLIGQMRGFI